MSLKLSKKLTAKQKTRLAEKLMDWGNNFFVGAVLAQILTKEYNIIIAFTGILFWLISFVVGLSIK